MYSLSVIQDMNRKAAQAAKGKKPYKAKADGDTGVRSMPNFGDYRPAGFELEEELFVDSSGFGSPGEPALTFEQFLNKVKAGKYYAIIEAGQFQV